MRRIIRLMGIAVLCAALCSSDRLHGQENGTTAQRAAQLYADGNYREALVESQRLLDDRQATVDVHRSAIERVRDCYAKLNEIHRMDEFLSSMAHRFSSDWQVLPAVAQAFLTVPHYGYEVAGEFRRGDHRGGGKVLNSSEHDRARALQLFWQAYGLASEELPNKASASDQASGQVAQLLDRMSQAILHGRTHNAAWRLQSLTNLEELPEHEAGWHHGGGQTQGAAVDTDGSPIFYAKPAAWDQSSNDGERWRWLLSEASSWSPTLEPTLLLRRAEFLQSQFGVQTLAQYQLWHSRNTEQDGSQDAGILALPTLKENESLARLATGIKRFELPEDQNYIKLLQSVREIAPPQSSEGRQAVERLASLFENRRQYPRAAEYWRMATEQAANKQLAEARLRQIIGNWGRFERIVSQPSGQGATIDFTYRNAKRVEFVARRIDVAQLLADVKEHLRSNPRQVDSRQLQIENLGYRLVTEGEQKYLGDEVARWSLDLEPSDHHFDRRITVTTPLQQAGAYLLTAKLEDGNTTQIVLWLNDTAIVKKPLSGASLYYVADAVTGKPIGKCNVEFFGYGRSTSKRGQGKRAELSTRNFAELTDENGLLTFKADEVNRRFNWLTIATTPAGRLAYMGFRRVWTGDYADQEYQQVKVFAVTDRPVYRPTQKLKFKFWVRQASYEIADESKYAAQSFQVEIRDPKNEKVFTTQLISDAYGGLTGEWEIPVDATLGQYRINVVNHGGGTFRVEEYKKPEFEVLVEAPDKPVQLGDTVTATISAQYFFGAPVTHGTLKYRILRTNHSQNWYPPMPWDWLYGPGYWWFSQEYSWYPGWARWGCLGPTPWWFWQANTPPEVVAEREIPLDEDGTIEVQIDTAIAKLLHPDQDHSYQIQAEVVDQSRRTIVGSGRVLVGREPFGVQLWVDRGYYRAGDTIAVGTAARTLDGQPVIGQGELRLLKVTYENAQPVETEVGTWDLPTGKDGQADLQIKASEPGQYRLSYELTDADEHTIEGGQMLTISGAGFDGSEFRFNDIELIPNQREYRAGDKLALQINTNRTGAAVLLFARPSNGIYQAPQLVQLDGKSTIVELDVAASDMPNFFVEALTVHGGKSHVATREIFVPPVERVLNVEVAPTSDAYSPGQAAKMLLKLTDENGDPFVGSLAVSIYDKAVEYISGGSNIADIKAFFWKWRRRHQPRTETNIERTSTQLVERGQTTMSSIGIFGDHIEADVGVLFMDNVQGRSARSEEKSPLPMAAMAEADGAPIDDAYSSSADEPAAEGFIQPAVRENFADTALWVGSLETNTEGIAEVELEMPENLTTWKVRAWGMGHGTRVGEGSAEVVTRKNVIVRLQAPRFFIETDEVVLSANVHNYLDEAKQVRVQLALEGDTLSTIEQLERTVEIEAGGEQRVDWRVKAVREGSAVIRMTALTDEESDSMQQTFPVHVHGMLKTESFTGVIKPDESSGQFTFIVPVDRRVEQTRLEVRYTPTLAGAMIDALPYLIEYPYGCTEQTLNRFLPAVITQQTLRRLGVDLATIQKKRTNLNAQEVGEERERSEAWQRFEHAPIFDQAELDRIVKAGVNRLAEMQLSDGGWGWFSGLGERSTAHTTAVVVRGLLIAEQNDVAIVPSVMQRGIAWLQDYQSKQIELLRNWESRAELDDTVPRKQFADNLDALVYATLVEAGKINEAMTGYLHRDRTRLAAYSLATYGLALHKQQDEEKLAMVMRNLGQFVQQDDENQTAWLNLPTSGWWYWYGSEYEAHAYYLKLLVATAPDSDIAPRLVKYLLNNRKHATYWHSTRDTALVIEAFADYLAATGEDDPTAKVELLLDGQVVKEVEITSDNLFSFDNRLEVAGESLAPGRHRIEIRKQGDGPIYFSGQLTNFTLEEDIRAAGLELKVERRYFKLTDAETSTAVAGGRGQVVTQSTESYDREPLVNFAEVTSGDLIEVELVVDSKNDYEYILLEDMKAAGFEPVDVRSGYGGNQLNAYMELRDDRVSLFVSRLARGRHSLSYRLRAETPGKFSALPTRVSAMYAPELKANSDEIKMRIVD